MRIYLDNCCFNRPYDDKSSINIKLEAEAKLYIQELIKEGKIELIWSYMLEYENSLNPFLERKIVIYKWKAISSQIIIEDHEVIENISKLENMGVKAQDAAHISSAIKAKCDYFITTDYKLNRLSGVISDINVINPIDFIRLLEEQNEN